MPRAPIPTYAFAITVVRLGRRFLLVQESQHGDLWYLPGGRVEPGEDFAMAAVRETQEEAGIRVVLDGVLRIEHTPTPDGSARLRVFFAGHPANDSQPKTVADEHSLRAAWATLEEVERLPLRGPEVREILRAVASGAPIYPMSCLVSAGTPWC